MAKINGDLKPNGVNHKDLVDIFYMIVSSMRGIAAKLDSDGSVTDTDYLANIDAVMSLIIESSGGSRVQVVNAESSILPLPVMASPVGWDQGKSSDLLYMVFDAWETLTEQLDADTNPPTSTDYEEVCYTDLFTAMVENSKGNLIGNGVTYYFRSGSYEQGELVNILYDIVNGIETFCEQADGDAAPADTDYEALWFTANITLTIEDSAGSRVGN